MTLYDDGLGVLHELLRPKSAISRMEAGEAAIPDAHPMESLGGGAILRVLEPSASESATRDALHLDQALQHDLPRPAYERWREHLSTVSVLASPLSDVLVASHTALFTPLAEDRDASLAWFSLAAGLPRLQLAALIPIAARRRRSRLSIETPLRCDLCDKPQHAAGVELQWLGSPESVALNVAPICRSCLGEAARDPQLWERRKLQQAGSTLRVIPGERSERSSAKDRGHLRLVRG